MNSSMEPCPIKNQKIKAMKSYKRAKIVYNFVLYTLTSIITCFFFSSPFWFPSISSHFVFSSLPANVLFCFNAKCFFVVGNLIVFILVGESKLKQSSSSSSSLDIYEEYVARSRRSSGPVNASQKTLIVYEENKEEIVKSEVWGESGIPKIEKPKVKREEQEKIKIGMRSSKSAVWGESGMLKMEKITKGSKKKEQSMRSSKSAVWGESGMVKMEKITKGKKEEQEKIKTGMRSSKSAVWGESEMVKLEKAKGKKEEKFVKEEEKKMGIVRVVESEIVESSKKAEGEKEEEIFTQTSVNDEEKKMGMRSCRSAVWGESEKGKGKKEEQFTHHEEKKKMGTMRSCRSEIWSESEIVRLGKTVAKEEEEQQLNMLNKRVEDFIARVNKQRLFEAKVVDHSRA